MQIALAVAMGISLAACAGIRTFLPLLALGIAMRLHVPYIPEQPWFAWTASNEALIIFGVASVLELLADKVPGLDHVLDLFHTVARPVAGSLVAIGAFQGMPPVYAVPLGIIVGAPIAGSFHLTRATTRVASTGFTFGLANPILSVLEDIIAILGVVMALVVPILTALLLGGLAFVIYRWTASRREKTSGASVSAR